MSVFSKLGRVARLRHLLGLRGAVALQAAWTVGRPLLHVQVRGCRQAFVLRRDEFDLSTLERVFLAQDCAVPLMSMTPRTIVDVGAHVGFMTAWFAERYPKATVVAVEPSPDDCALLRQNTCSYPNVRVLNSALWARGARLRVRDLQAPAACRQVEECDPIMQRSLEAVTMLDLLDQAAEGTIDLLKLDVGSAQRVLFSSNVDAWLDGVRTIVIELSESASYPIVRSALRSKAFVERVRGGIAIFDRTPSPGRVALPSEPVARRAA